MLAWCCVRWSVAVMHACACRRRLLTARGWLVLSVPFYDYYELHSVKSKVLLSLHFRMSAAPSPPQNFQVEVPVLLNSQPSLGDQESLWIQLHCIIPKHNGPFRLMLKHQGGPSWGQRPDLPRRGWKRYKAVHSAPDHTPAADGLPGTQAVCSGQWAPKTLRSVRDEPSVM